MYVEKEKQTRSVHTYRSFA